MWVLQGVLEGLYEDFIRVQITSPPYHCCMIWISMLFVVKAHQGLGLVNKTTGSVPAGLRAQGLRTVFDFGFRAKGSGLHRVYRHLLQPCLRRLGICEGEVVMNSMSGL